MLSYAPCKRTSFPSHPTRAPLIWRRDGTAKIADVGLAKIIAHEYSAVTGAVGTLAWVSLRMSVRMESCQAAPGPCSKLPACKTACYSCPVRVHPPAFRATRLLLQAASRPACWLLRPPLQSSPEMLLGARCTEKSDIYSYGEQLPLVCQLLRTAWHPSPCPPPPVSFMHQPCAAQQVHVPTLLTPAACRPWPRLQAWCSGR